MNARSGISIGGTVRARRDEAQWRGLLREFEAGTESRRAFCDRHDIALSTFDWWRKRIAATTPPERPVDRGALMQRARPTFIELAAPVSKTAPSRIAVAARGNR